MIKREIEISGKKVPFRSSATIPRLYRAKFKRDIFKDLSKLEKSYKGKTENGEELADRGFGDLRECGLCDGLPCRQQHSGKHRGLAGSVRYVLYL